jgi:hypothetical protein
MWGVLMAADKDALRDSWLWVELSLLVITWGELLQADPTTSCWN